jgi:hypothetical protein
MSSVDNSISGTSAGDRSKHDNIKLGAPHKDGDHPCNFFDHPKCCVCVDEHLQNASVVLKDAITMAPTTQIVTIAGQTLASIVALPVCLEHRRKQLAPASKTGLVAA